MAGRAVRNLESVRVVHLLGSNPGLFARSLVVIEVLLYALGAVIVVVVVACSRYQTEARSER